MKREILRAKAKGALLVFSLLVGAAFIAAVPSVQAQYRNDPYYGGYDIYRVAQDQGYRDGMEQGARDGRDRNRYRPEDSGRYKDATRGYHSEYGNKEAYKQAYREGFRRGYDQGFRQYTYGGNNNDPYYGNDPYYRNDPYGRGNDPYGRTGGYPNGRYDIYQVAQEQGYRDGFQRGTEDARDGDRYNPEGSSQYRNADRGYRSEYGNKDEYRRAYRDAFRRGYDESYRRQDRGVYRGNTSDRARRIGNILGTILGRP